MAVQVRCRAVSVLPIMLATLLAGSSSRVASQRTAEPVSASPQTIMLRADTLLSAGKREEGYALLAGLADDAAARGDERLQLEARTRLGSRLTWFGEPGRGAQVLRSALPGIEARRDSALMSEAMAWLGISFGLSAEYDRADSVYRRALPVAVSIGDRPNEARIRLGAAYVRLQTGRFDEARSGYLDAIRLYRETGNIRGELDAHTGLGRAYTHLGRLANARAEFERVVSLARERGLKNNEADGLNNVGDIEYLRGDPQEGLRYFREALAIRRSIGIPYAGVVPALNVARSLAALGRFHDAKTALDSLLVVCRENGFRDQEAGVGNILGDIHEDAGALADAKRQYEAILAMRGQLSAYRFLQAYRGVARCLAGEDSVEAAIAILRGPAADLLRDATADDRLAYDLDLADVLLLSPSDLDAAREAAHRADSRAEEILRPAERVRALAVAADAEIRLGDITSARRSLDTAEALWEQVRAMPLDHEWRENRSRGQPLCILRVETILADASADRAARVGAAFDAAQRFKARTFLDRVRGPVVLSGGDPPRTDGTQLQERVLRDGEILLDAHVGRQRSYLFALSRHACDVAVLPGERELRESVDLVVGLLAGRPRPDGGDLGASQEQAIAALRARLLGELPVDWAGVRTILFAPDGPLHRLPLEILFDAPGEGNSNNRASRPVVARTPCGAFLALHRSGAKPEGASTPKVSRGAAVGGGVDARGRELRGASKEVAMLARHYRGIEAWRSDPGDGSTDQALPLGEYDLIHVAAHTVLDEERPWRSAIRIGGEGGAADTASWLRAESIVGSRLAARMVVLSGCASAGGRAVPGEGLQGLSTAFLAAGVPSVVATLWPVDDAVTTGFMRRFYAALARGATVGEALGAARSEVAAGTNTAAPFYWAGFILIGEPGTEVPLNRRQPALLLVLAAAAGVVVLGTGVAALRRRSRPVR